ncbi:MAG: hypothetical protein H0V51_18465 [Chloroflexi bacterium]|nr:hypothetical protein [Chloroflexota bacterium]
MGLLDRLFGRNKDGGTADGGDLEGAVRTLIEMYDLPDVKAESGLSITGRHAEEVRTVGRNLHKAGGKESMVAARDGLRQRLPWAASNLEAIWASLPQWKG